LRPQGKVSSVSSALLAIIVDRWGDVVIKNMKDKNDLEKTVLERDVRASCRQNLKISGYPGGKQAPEPSKISNGWFFHTVGSVAGHNGSPDLTLVNLRETCEECKRSEIVQLELKKPVDWTHPAPERAFRDAWELSGHPYFIITCWEELVRKLRLRDD
jgi:hypothetical protein